MLKEKIKELMKSEGNNKKKIENIIYLMAILIVTIIIINFILKGNDTSLKKENYESVDKKLATSMEESGQDNTTLQKQLEQILSTIRGVGKVNVFISYSESSKTIAMYDEKTTTSSTEETDSSGGIRNTTSTQTQKDVIFSEQDGSQIPMTEKVIMPTIEGAIITAQGARNSTVRINIINAVKSATGLSMDKIQVFEMEGYSN